LKTVLHEDLLALFDILHRDEEHHGDRSAELRPVDIVDNHEELGAEDGVAGVGFAVSAGGAVRVDSRGNAARIGVVRAGSCGK
jgi:hypothetical protein